MEILNVVDNSSTCNCGSEPRDDGDRIDLAIIGGGSAAFAAAIKSSELGRKAVIINDGLPIGGTCVNVGCVPSKALIRAAESNHLANTHRFKGIETQGSVTDFGAVTADTAALVTDLRTAKYINVVADDPNVEIIEGRGRLVDANTIDVDGRVVTAENILIATGATTYVPDIPGLSEVPYLTNESAYALTDLPEELIVLGGRYIALENAQLFARLGSKVTVLQRSGRIMPSEAEDLSNDLSRLFEAEGLSILTSVSIDHVSEKNGRIEVAASVGGVQQTITGTHILVATGRKGNSDGLGLEELGIEVYGHGYIRVDDTLRTSVPNIFVAGDITGEQQFVYTAAYEGALAAENAYVKMHKKRDYSALPWVVFTDPQVAGVGMDESQAEAAGTEYEVARLDLEHVPRSIAARDTRGFIKLLRDPATDLLIGARILAPEGSELLMEVTLAIKHNITVAELTSAFHPYLTLSEGIKLAAITFGKDVGKLSCCAV